MSISCFGNATLGEASQAIAGSLNQFKDLDYSFDIISGGSRCVIPGFAPPNLPNFAIPPIPVFGGIPAFSVFCLLPPFPGLPALSLPGISIPIPPIPFFPPIPLPMLGFALPSLPFLPSFDLGSLSFICGLININLPVLDPFAFINDAISDLNGMINALNNFMDFCKTNSEAIYATQVPPAEGVSSYNYSDPADCDPVTTDSDGLVPSVVEGDPCQPNSTSPTMGTASADLGDIKFNPDEDATNLADYLANNGSIPSDPALINKLKALLSNYDKIGDIDDLQGLLDNNNIPSASDFLGFTSQAIAECLSQSNNSREFIQCLIAAGLLCNAPNVIQKCFATLSDVDYSKATSYEVALLLNTSGVPFGPVCTNLLQISSEDISRSFYLRDTTLPITSNKIVDVLIATSVIDIGGDNVGLALKSLETLPENLTPTTIAERIIDVFAGPAAGSLRAACISSSKGLNPESIIDIQAAQTESLLRSVNDISKTRGVDVLATISYEQFKVMFRNIPYEAPYSIYSLIPIISIQFDLDDKVIYELLANMVVPSSFDSIESVYQYLTSLAKITRTTEAALGALDSCKALSNGDFSFNSYVEQVETTLIKYGVSLEDGADKNAAAALSTELKLDYSEVLAVVNSAKITTAESLAFYCLAIGLFTSVTRTADTGSVSSSISTSLSNPIKTFLLAPSGSASHILPLETNITITTTSAGSLGTTTKVYNIVENGRPSSGSTVTQTINDKTSSLEIVITKIGGFSESSEAILSIEVEGYYQPPAVSEKLEIPDNYVRTNI